MAAARCARDASASPRRQEPEKEGHAEDEKEDVGGDRAVKKRRGGDVVPNGAVGDWRLEGASFLASFRKPGEADKHDVLAKRHPLPRDARIAFDEESHTYTVDGSHVVRCSVTRFIHAFATDFDADAAIAAMKRSRRRPWAQRHREDFAHADGRLMTDAEIKEKWRLNGEEQSARGTLMHWHIEMTLNDLQVEEPHSPEYQHFLVWRRELMEARGWTPFRTELSLMHVGLGIAGQADCLCTDSDGHVVIVDWKRSKKIDMTNERGRKLRPPLDAVDDCNFELYTIQVNVYRHILETEYGMTVSQMWLAVFHPNQSGPLAYRVRRADAEMAAILQWAERNMGAQAPNPDPDAPFVRSSDAPRRASAAPVGFTPSSSLASARPAKVPRSLPEH